MRSYTWNARNELTGLTGPVNGSFAYDGVGPRRAKTIGGTATQFLYDGLNLVQELSGGSPVANLLTGLGIDEYFTRTDAAGVRNYLTDALGSSLALADGSGTVLYLRTVRRDDDQWNVHQQFVRVHRAGGGWDGAVLLSGAVLRSKAAAVRR